MNRKLQQLGEQIIKTLDSLPGNDPQTKRVRMHVQSLLEALGTPISDSSIGATNVPASAFPNAPDAFLERSFAMPQHSHRNTLADSPQALINSPGGGSGPPTATRPPSVVPKTYAERRALRRSAGVTLREVADQAHTTLPTARMYEANRMAVTKPDKRADLDRVYEQFVNK